MKPLFVKTLLTIAICFAAHTVTGQTEAFLFDWTSVAGDLDFAKPIHSSFAFTNIYGGEGRVTCLQDLPATESVAGNPPSDLDFIFGSGGSPSIGDPALSLTGFDNDGTVVIQEFTATPDNVLEVFNLGNKVANGVVLDVTVLTPPSLISAGYGHFQLTDDGGGDPTIFAELFALSGNTGIISFSLANFLFSGTGTDPAVFVAEGIGAPGTPPGLDPTNPLLPSIVAGGFVFDIPAFPDCVPPPIFFDPAVTIGYDFEATGTTFASIILPDIGDGTYDLYMWNGSEFFLQQVLIAGEEYDFEAPGAERFRILGIEESAGLDPNDPLAFVAGFTFTSTNAASMTMSPIVPDADFNQDGDIDGNDFLAWQRNTGLTSGASLAQGDANANGVVDDVDLTIWQAQFGTAETTATTTTPEPSAIFLVMLGLASACCCRGRHWESCAAVPLTTARREIRL